MADWDVVSEQPAAPAPTPRAPAPAPATGSGGWDVVAEHPADAGPGLFEGIGQVPKSLLKTSADIGDTLLQALGRPLAQLNDFLEARDARAYGTPLPEHSNVEDVDYAAKNFTEPAQQYWQTDNAKMGRGARAVDMGAHVVGSIPSMVSMAPLFLLNAGFQPAKHAIDQGTDSTTAGEIGGANLLVNALGLKVPGTAAPLLERAGLGPLLAKPGAQLAARVGTGAAVNPAIGAAGAQAEKKIYEANGEHALADAVHPLDPETLALQTLMGAGFGVADHVNAPRRTPEPAPSASDATPRQGEPMPAAGTTAQPAAEAAPAPVARTPFASPDAHARDEFVKRAAAKGVDPQLAHELAPQAPVDRTTGFVDGRQGATDATIERAQQHVAETGEPAVWVGGDIANLGGLNKHFGSRQTDADVHYKAMAEILHDELRATGGDVVPLRTGGDEVGAVVVNADRPSVDAALDRARERVQAYAAEHGLDTIPHKETGRAPGVGMHFGAADIAPGLKVKEILDEADNGIDRSRNEGGNNVAAVPVEAPRDGAPGGQPVGDRGGSEPPVAGIPAQARGGEGVERAGASGGRGHEGQPAGVRQSGDAPAGSDPHAEVARLTQDVAAARAAGDSTRVSELTPQLQAAQERASAPPVPEPATPAPMAPEPAYAPAEPVRAPLPPTGTKHAVTDAERATEGRPAREPHETQPDEVALERARTDLEANPHRGAEVVEKLRNAGVNGISVHDEAVLMAHKVAVRNRRDAAADRATDPSLSAEERAVARREYDEANAEVIAIDDAAANSGREWGRFGQLRSREIRADFSFEAMERKARIAHDRPLTPEEVATVRAQAEKIEALQKRLDEAESRAAFAEQQRVIVKEGRAAAGKQRTRSERLQRMEQRASEARARLRAKLGTAHSGVDPGMFADAATIGAYHLMRGVTAAAEWAKAIRADLGDKLFRAIEPRLDELRRAAETLAAKEKLSVDAILQKIDPNNVTSRDVSQLVRAHILDGLDTYDAVMDAVHADLAGITKVSPEEVRELYVTPPPKKAPPVGSPEAATVKRIAGVKDKTEAGEFDKPERTERAKSKVEEKLAFELAQAKAEFARQQFEAEMARRPAWKKVFGGVGEALGVARAYQTGLDASAVLRQGGFITMQALVSPRKAVLTGKATVAMLRAMRSAEAEHAINAEIASRPNAPLYKRYGLELTDAHHHSLSKMEEAFMSRWIDRLPKSVGGGLIRGSNRGYTTFLNKLRADSFDQIAATLGKTGELSKEEGEAVARFINIATGRGTIGEHNRAAVGLNTVFFAPRLVASRFQLLAGAPLYGGSARTRKLIAGEYARFLAGTAVVYGLASLMTDKDKGDGIVTFDPRSSDFGKIKVGNTYVDPLAGLAQVTSLVGKVGSGTKVSSSGKVSTLRTDGDSKPAFGADNAFDVMARFARTKLAPVPGAFVDWRTGEDVVGNPVTKSDIVGNLVQPMSLQDIGKIMQENGVPQGTTIEMLNLLGMGVQYRQPREQKPSRKGNGITYN
jgi:hypothetical protein